MRGRYLTDMDWERIAEKAGPGFVDRVKNLLLVIKLANRATRSRKELDIESARSAWDRAKEHMK